jgi:acetyl-CoA decarbonylase/synthase complex subunit gamma
MKSMFLLIIALSLVAAGAAGQWLEIDVFKPYAIWFLGGGLVILCSVTLRITYYRTGYNWSKASNQPRPLRLTLLDYIKAFVCWLNAFKRTYAIEPGLYYTGGRYDRKSPLIVTSNYFLTVFLVIRRVREFNVRLLVIDTDGINVWCSASEGQFSHDEILKQLGRYQRSLLTNDRRLSLILPKLSLAGVNLKTLRKAKIQPIIGPIYAKDLPTFLSQPPLEDRTKDQVLFGMQSRLYTWLPGLWQSVGYSFAIVLLFWGIEQIWGFPVPVGIVFLTGILATAYPILFPWIPGVRFAVKGLWMAAIISLGICALTALGVLSLPDLPMTLLFTFGTAVFFGLSYTGNSAVSNYSRVRKEIARFLPLYVSLYAASLTAFVITEVNR